MKISEIEAKIAAAQAAKDDMLREQEEAFKASSELRKKAEDAAAAGDVEKYLRVKSELDKQEAISYVRKTQLERQTAPVSMADFTAAWNDYAADYSKKLASLRGEYKKAKDAALSAYGKMIELHHDALVQRQRLAELAGIPAVDNGRVSSEAERSFPMEYIVVRPSSPDAVSFRVGGLGVLNPDAAFYFGNLGHDTMVQLCRDEEVRRILGESHSHI